MSGTDKFHTSITLKLVPVSTKFRVSVCTFATFFQENLPWTFPEKSYLIGSQSVKEHSQ